MRPTQARILAPAPRPLGRWVLLLLPLLLTTAGCLDEQAQLVRQAERTMQQSWHCWEGENDALFSIDRNLFMVYDFLDVRVPRWCRKHATVNIIEARDALDFDFILDHHNPPEEVDYQFYVRPIAPNDARSTLPNFLLIWDWTVLDAWEPGMRDDITVECEVCSNRFGDYEACDTPIPPWPIQQDYWEPGMLACPATDYDPNLSE